MEWFKIKEFSEYETQINIHNKKITSQNGEDGIIDYIFKNIGTTNQKSCEIGFHSTECNTLELMKKGWNCLFVDYNYNQVRDFKKKYSNFKKSNAIQCKVDKENINEILIQNNMSGSIDFLSLDVDGNDYYILKNISICSPRVLCIEYNASFGPEICCSVPYNSNRPDSTVDYWGASYNAFVKLLKDYYLVAVTSGVNLFFIRKDINLNNILKIEKAWQPPYSSTYTNNKLKHENRLKEQFDKIKNLKLILFN